LSSKDGRGFAGQTTVGRLPHGYAGYFNTMGSRCGRAVSSTSTTIRMPSGCIVMSRWSGSTSRTRPAGASHRYGAVPGNSGVVADAKLYGLDAPVEPAFMCLTHSIRKTPPCGGGADGGRSYGNGCRDTQRDPEARSRAAGIERAQHGGVLSDSLMLRRVSMLLLTVFAALALTLATVEFTV